MHKAGPMAKFPKMLTLIIANSNTKYVIRVDFYDDQAEMEISIMARKLPNEKYVFDNK